MRNSLVAPSTPNTEKNSNLTSEIKHKKSFLGKLFTKKAKDKPLDHSNKLNKTKDKPFNHSNKLNKTKKTKENKKILPEIPTKQDTTTTFLNKIEEEHFDIPKHEPHALDHISKIDSDIQIDYLPTENKPQFIPTIKETKHSSLNSIEEVSFDSKAKEKKDDSFNINRLREAIGIIKNKSDKEMKIESFRNTLSNEIREEGEIVTNLKLEEKLGEKLNGTPTELVEHLKMGITMDLEVPEENMFMLSDGRKLRSLRDLRNALENMSEGIFSNHVYGRKNDFANWIKKIFNEPKLANITRKCKTIETLLSMLVTLEKKEIRELIKLKEKEILKEHTDSLRDLTVSNEERKELEEERSSVEELRKEFQEKLKELQTKNLEINQKSEKTRLDLETEKEKEKHLEQQKKDYLELVKSESCSLNNLRDKILIETDKSQTKLNEDFLHRKQELEREYKTRLDRLKLDREQFVREQNEADKLYHTKLKELRVEEEKIYGLQRELKEQELRLLEKENRIREILTQLSRKLIESKDLDLKLTKDINKKNNLLLDIKQKQEELENRKLKLEREGFQNYIDEELKKLSNPQAKRIKIAPTDEDIELLYSLIDGCRMLIKARKIKEAKTAYQEVRQTYYRLNISKEDEELIFNSIRELYSDIELYLIPKE